MSIFAMNWALQQRLDSPQPQILLYVIADSADATGRTVHCDPDYMAERARMSRPTLFRRLTDLEDLGLLQRFKSYSEHGAQIYEIRLNFEVIINQEIRSRRSSEGDENTTEDSADPATHGRPKSHRETLVEPTKVSPVRQPESHSGDSQEDPPISQEDSPKPPSGAGVPEISDEVKKRFDFFMTSCLGYRTQGQDRPLAMFLLLDEAEQIACAAASPVHAAECTKARKKSLDAWKLIRERFWLRYPEARLPVAAPARHWIGGADLAAVDLALRLAGRPGARTVEDPERGRGYWRQGEPLSADLKALAGYADQDPQTLLEVVAGSPNFAAWRDRLQSWLGGEVAGERLWLEDYDPTCHSPGCSAMSPGWRLRV